MAVGRSENAARLQKYPRLGDLRKAKDLLSLTKHLPASAWQQVSWRQGSRRPQQSRFALLKGCAAHGWHAKKHPERVPEWLLIEWPRKAQKPVRHWLGQLGPATPRLLQQVNIPRSPWRIELDYRELKEELGLDHFDGL